MIKIWKHFKNWWNPPSKEELKPKTLEELNKRTVEEVKAKKCSLSLDPDMVEAKRYVSTQKKSKKKVIKS